jgi:hypothetical protein
MWHVCFVLGKGSALPVVRFHYGAFLNKYFKCLHRGFLSRADKETSSIGNAAEEGLYPEILYKYPVESPYLWNNWRPRLYNIRCKYLNINIGLMMNKIQALLVVLMLCLGVALNAASKKPKTADWVFTQKEYNELTSQQKDVIKKSYWIGKSYGLGNTLAAISIVESRAGAIQDRRHSKICGPHQVDTTIAKENLATSTSAKEICKELKSNPTLSAIVSLEILLYWKDNSKSYKGMLNKYNRGWQESPYDDEYYRRFIMTLKVLENNNIEVLK